MRLHGRYRAIALVREFMERPDRGHIPRSRRLPVLVFTGPAGSGKTALLEDLARRLHQNVPYAYVDVAQAKGATTQDLLAIIAFELNRHSAAYGSLAFPRFIVGRLVMAAEGMDHTDPGKARHEIGQLLAEHRKIHKLRAFLEGMAPDMPAAVGASDAPGAPGGHPASRYPPGLLLDGMTSWRGGGRVALGGGQSWYGHQDQGLTDSEPLDALVELNRRAKNLQAGGNIRWVGELLWRAFLADLRDDFGRGGQARWRTLNCVILIDNADEAVGSRFLRELVQARAHHAAGMGNGADPAVVVATGRGTIASHAAGPSPGIPQADEASLDDYLKQRDRPGAYGPWWYPVRLPDLTQADVGAMVGDLRPQGCDTGHVKLAVHGFTRGHPGSTRILIEAIAEQPRNPVELRRVLEQVVRPTQPVRPAQPGAGAHERTTVRERLWQGFLAGLRQATIDDLVTCAAVRSMAHIAPLVAHGELLRGDDSMEITRPELWTVAGSGVGAGAGAGGTVLHPVLRSLLLERLAERGADEPARWSAVHEWLREQSAQAGDEAGELYHTLALGDLPTVSKRLEEALVGMDVDDWLRLLRAVVSAPRQHATAGAPVDDVGPLTNGWVTPASRPSGPLARLVAALWIEADPLISSEREQLHISIRNAFRDIAPFSPNGLAVLHGEAERHDALAELWG